MYLVVAFLLLWATGMVIVEAGLWLAEGWDEVARRDIKRAVNKDDHEDKRRAEGWQHGRCVEEGVTRKRD